MFLGLDIKKKFKRIHDLRGQDISNKGRVINVTMQKEG